MTRSMPKITSMVLAAMLAVTGSVTAQDQGQNQDQSRNPDPYARPNDSWITIRGTVQSVRPDAFTLAYGDGRITVEMDDEDRDADAYVLMEGDSVTVNGTIDDDVFESATIEANSVYVHELDTYFYASALDEEDAYSDQGAWWRPHHGIVVLQPADEASTTLSGTVTEILGDDEFKIDRGAREVTVDVGEMDDNPLDDEGYRKIAVGDYVTVHGEMDDDLFEERELQATSVTTIFDSSHTTDMQSSQDSTSDRSSSDQR
ncbi:MAG: NirD/YgiW/YdeI family stress tolerance protein [Gemmatimonadales bacterium]